MHIDDIEEAGRLIRHRKLGIALRDGARAGLINAEVHGGGGRVDVFSVIAADPIRAAIVAEAEAFIKGIEVQLDDIGVTVVRPLPVVGGE